MLLLLLVVIVVFCLLLIAVCCSLFVHGFRCLCLLVLLLVFKSMFMPERLIFLQLLMVKLIAGFLVHPCALVACHCSGCLFVGFFIIVYVFVCLFCFVLFVGLLVRLFLIAYLFACVFVVFVFVPSAALQYQFTNMKRLLMSHETRYIKHPELADYERRSRHKQLKQQQEE